jgi:hypothetical protein
MPARDIELLDIPDWFWNLPQTIAVLQARNIGKLFVLIHDQTGASQTQIAAACEWTQPKISAIVRGSQKVRHLARFEHIASSLKMPDHARIILGLAPRASSPLAVPAQRPPEDVLPALPADRVSDLLSLDPGDGQEEEEDPVRRRDFVGLAGASMLGAMLASDPDHSLVDADPLAAVLIGHPAGTAAGRIDTPPDVAALAETVSRARRDYQACRYSELIKYLPALLAQLHAASIALDGDEQLRVHALSADAHHVAAGLLLKLDDQGLAYLAADRSMRAASASEDPLMVGASARIITHTLMRGGHLGAATTAASSYAAQLDRDVPSHTPESLSVYGSILLRGAIAAAEHDNRRAAHELLDEADDAAQRLGIDGNLRGTGFGPANARQHRVNIAVTLGDAGTAVQVARGIDLSAIKLTERKASLLIDTSRAFLMWGKHEKAYLALRAAEETAHEEVASRPAVHRLVRELVTSAPPSLRRDAEQFASHIGVSR